MFIVLKTFKDKEDEDFNYEIGRPYQRINAKKQASEERIEFLLENGFIADENEIEDIEDDESEE